MILLLAVSLSLDISQQHLTHRGEFPPTGPDIRLNEISVLVPFWTSLGEGGKNLK